MQTIGIIAFLGLAFAGPIDRPEIRKRAIDDREIITQAKLESVSELKKKIFILRNHARKCIAKSCS